MADRQAYVGSIYPIRDHAIVQHMLTHMPDDNTLDGRTEWKWIQLASGELVMGFFPQGIEYETCEVYWVPDELAASNDGTQETLWVDESDIGWREVQR